jgi:hypothetical protein
VIARNRILAALESPYADTYVTEDLIWLHTGSFMEWTAIPKSACPVQILYSHWPCFPTYTQLWLIGSVLVSGVTFAWLSCPPDTSEGSGADCEWCINVSAGLPVTTPKSQWSKYPDRLTVFPAGGGLQTCMVIVRIARLVPTDTVYRLTCMPSLADRIDGAGSPSDTVRASLYRPAKDRGASVMEDHDHLKSVGKACRGGNSIYNHTVLTQTLHILGIAKSQTGGRPATVAQSFRYMYDWYSDLFLKDQPDLYKPCLVTKLSALSDVVLEYVGRGMTAVDTQLLFTFASVDQHTRKYYLAFGGELDHPTRRDTSFRMAEWMVCLDLASRLASISMDPDCLWLRGLDHFGKPNQGLYQVLAAQIKSTKGRNPGSRGVRSSMRALRALASTPIAHPSSPLSTATKNGDQQFVPVYNIMNYE